MQPHKEHLQSFGYGTFEPTLSDFWWASSIINTRSCYIDIAPSIQVGNQHSVLIVCSLQMVSPLFIDRRITTHWCHLPIFSTMPTLMCVGHFTRFTQTPLLPLNDRVNGLSL
jgi:hypothetical protein